MTKSVCGIEFGAHGGDDFVGDAAFDLLALAVAGVQLMRDGQRLVQAAGQQQAQRVFGGFEAAGGVETGRELEADFVCAERDRGLSDSFQRDQARALGGVEALQANGSEDAVLAGQRNDVGDGAEGDQIEQGAQVKVRGAGQAGFASALEESVRELEGEAGGTEFGEGGGELKGLKELIGLNEGAGGMLDAGCWMWMGAGLRVGG